MPNPYENYPASSITGETMTVSMADEATEIQATVAGESIRQMIDYNRNILGSMNRYSYSDITSDILSEESSSTSAPRMATYRGEPVNFWRNVGNETYSFGTAHYYGVIDPGAYTPKKVKKENPTYARCIEILKAQDAKR